MDVLHLNKESFEKLTAQKEKALLVDFWAVWCGPCQKLGPELEKLAADHSDLVVGKVNVDDNMELAVQLGVDSIPALFYYRNGQLEKRLTGYRSKEDLERELDL
ncbi:MAG: thioredoxin [Lentisphaeria bacterium]|nr:thioredoxin [Lentisphaeria bacterium]